MTIRVGSLFAGIGGFDLAAQLVGWETAWFSEIDPYASLVLKKHWPTVPNHGDITQIDFEQVEKVHVLCGGFPCQDISIANQWWSTRLGLDGAKSGLWSHYERAIGILRPRVVVVENSPELFGRGIDRVLGGLAALGYDAEWDCIPAAFVGAFHRRNRAWIVAYPSGTGRIGPVVDFHALPVPDEAARAVFGDPSTGPWDTLVADSQDIRTGDGLSLRLDRARLHGCGNAVVPQIPELLFRAIQTRGLL